MANDLTIERRGASPHRQVRFPSHLFVHPGYDLFTFANDIAVVRASVPFYNVPQLFPLPRSISTPPDNQICYLAGWWEWKISSESLARKLILGVWRIQCALDRTQFYFELISTLSVWVFAMARVLTMEEYRRISFAQVRWMDRGMRALGVWTSNFIFFFAKFIENFADSGGALICQNQIAGGKI